MAGGARTGFMYPGQWEGTVPLMQAQNGNVIRTKVGGNIYIGIGGGRNVAFSEGTHHDLGLGIASTAGLSLMPICGDS